MSRKSGRLTIVQYAGDFREASQRLASGGAENYGSQRYTVEYVENLARSRPVTTITGFTSEAYDTVLPSGMRSIGAGFTDTFDSKVAVRLLKDTKPDLVVLRSPIWRILVWLMISRRRTLVLLADSFDLNSKKGKIKLGLLAAILRLPMFDVIANHGRRSAEQLINAGVPANKVLAWDYPPLYTPYQHPTKIGPSAARRLLYVGMLTADKGVNDLIKAVSILKKQGVAVHLDLVGKGDLTAWKSTLHQEKLSDVVSLVGQVPHSEVMLRMTQADAVVVPSTHQYPEGLPLTIYEAYCSRTPLITSDHPMFVGSVVPEFSALVFAAGRPNELANQISRLFSDRTLYCKLSEGGVIAWQEMQIPVKWADLIDRWLDDSVESRAWIRDNSLAHVAQNSCSATRAK